MTDNLKLQLVGPAQTLPEGTGPSQATLTAKVTAGTAPRAGVTLSFSVDVTAHSGGHDHHDATRPKGAVSISQGVTDANGEVKFIFKAPEIAGIHTIRAVCASCSNSPVSKQLDVKVPDLLNVFTMPYRDAQWAYPGIGQRGEHSDQHYLTVAAASRMLDITQKFSRIWPNAPKLTLNDASLIWGGKFDISGTWQRNSRAHAEHRKGENIDVRANSAPGAVPSNIRESVFRWLRKASRPQDNIPPDLVIESVNPLWENPGVANEHFHLRLGN